jgi:hypothetical protein
MDEDILFFLGEGRGEGWNSSWVAVSGQ